MAPVDSGSEPPIESVGSPGEATSGDIDCRLQHHYDIDLTNSGIYTADYAIERLCIGDCEPMATRLTVLGTYYAHHGYWTTGLLYNANPCGGACLAVLELTDSGDSRMEDDHVYNWSLWLAVTGSSGLSDAQAHYISGPFADCNVGFTDGRMTMTKVDADSFMFPDHCAPDWPATVDVCKAHI
jgi:hypothetical protein